MNKFQIGQKVNKFRKQKMVITNIDEDDFIEINNSFTFNSDFLEIVGEV